MTTGELKSRLPLPELMARCGDGEHAKEKARCLLPEKHKNGDRNPSAGIYQDKNGNWRFKCHGCGVNMGEPDYLKWKFSLATEREAFDKWRKLAGVNGQHKPTAAKPEDKTETDLGDAWRTAVEAFTDEDAATLSAWRGYSREFCEWLRRRELVGLHKGNIAFPVHDDTGRVVGIHYQVKPKTDGQKAEWFYTKGCKAHPLVIGDAKTAAGVMAFESQWDAFAVMDKLGWHKSKPEAEAVIITRGASNGKMLSGLCGQESTVMAFRQNDDAGADWQHAISEHAKRKVIAVSIPKPHKDANDWTRAGATADEIGKAIAAAKVVTAAPAPLAETDLKDGMNGSLVSGAELQAMAVEPREFILRPFFKVGDLGFIYAKRGDGKTWLTMLLTKAATTAGKAGPWQSDRSFSVLYVDGEMPAEETKRRDRMLGTTTDRLSFLHHEIYFERTGRTLNLADTGQQEAMARLLVEREIKVLVLDNLSCLFSGVKENDADPWGEMVLPWLLRLRRLKIAVVIVAHAGRNGEMRGTSKREDQAFWTIKLERVAGDEKGMKGMAFTSMFTKNRNALEDDCPPLEWTIAEDATGAATITTKRLSGVELLVSWVEIGMDRASDIAQEMHLSKGQVSKLAKLAEAQSRITIKNRRYLPIGGGSQ